MICFFYIILYCYIVLFYVLLFYSRYSEKINTNKLTQNLKFKVTSNSLNELYENISHEILSIKIYRNNISHKINQPILLGKFNLILFRSYTIYDSILEKKLKSFEINNINKNDIDNNNYNFQKNFQNFPKENFNFFNSLINKNFRTSKLSRCIKVFFFLIIYYLIIYK